MAITRGARGAPADASDGRGGIGRIGSRELIVLISAIMALMALGIDLLLPAFDDIRDEFGLSDESTQISQVITAFFLGLSTAQLVWGPLADRFGRKPILLAGIGVYAFGAAASAFAPSLAWLLGARFVWGVGAAAARVVATAIIRDVFEGTDMAKAMSQVMAVFVMAPVFAPSIGAGLIIAFSWKAIFWSCVVWSALIVAWSFRLPETLRPEHRRNLEFRSIASGFAEVARNPITAGYTLATVFMQGIFAAYLGSSERIVNEVFGRGPQFPIIFGATAILFGVGAIINGRVVGKFGTIRIIHTMSWAVLAMTLVLLAVSVAAGGRPQFWVFMPLLGINLSMFMFLMPNLNTEALVPMGELAGTASSVTGAARIFLGAFLGAAVDSQVTDSTTPFVVAFVIFAVCLIASVRWAERHGVPTSSS
jgi:DHA1 family bicyclomycin/chloramphenicol resistance-like MFS transporter